ncbi:unnamed protein product [Mycena citricolor]|uniref:Protein kinase domain-containing protein n=1 Tax=Mycena citricolor TaxID=2018698 RepID=A0AAD2K6N0_9AGAR|nr:unnamed protein product [Mycena citricolor]
MDNDFDLPRWSSQVDHGLNAPHNSSLNGPLSSTAAAASAAQASYYREPPPGSSQSIARSHSLGGASASARRRHHNQEELDPSFYPHFNDSSNGQNQYQPQSDPMYYSKRAEPPRSPLRTPNSALLDPYAHQQAQYSPSTPQYPYGPPQAEQRGYTSSNPQTHNRTLSQVKAEPGTPYTPNYNQGNQYLDQLPRQGSVSNPSTPLSYLHPSPGYYTPDSAMAVDPPPQKRRVPGFRRIRGAHDLQPRTDIPATSRRMAADGTYLSPLRQLTTNLIETFHICNPQFRYESAHNPRRVLTKPSKPSHNEGYDNEDYDYILYVNDWLGTEDGHKYLILDILGQGTFGQVVKCQNMKTHEVVAVKVVKNKPAYFNQSMMEVTILEMLNKNSDPNDQHHILRLRDSFIHRSHLCLVFELLSSNLYELIKQNQFQGLSTQLVKVFMAQLLDAMTVLKEARLIHCDLKPENILLKSLQSPQIKVIDFGSTCHERQTVYTYIQSRFYRSPEVLLGMPYTASIDMWSLGCIAVELFLGLPLFPGTSEYNQLTRIVEMLGLPPASMMSTGKQTTQFFDSHDQFNPTTGQNEKKWRLKSLEQYSREHGTNEQPGKQYFKANTLPEIINTAPMPQTKTGRTHEVEKELNNRAAFVDFCQGLLDLNPVTRWTPQQARLHPFITGEKFVKPFVPDGLAPPAPIAPAVVDPKRPYGGLVPSQPKGTRAYTDAASYNHHLGQHQAYTAAQQAQQNQAGAFRNPYMTPASSQQQSQLSQSQSNYPSPPENSYQGQGQSQVGSGYSLPPSANHRAMVAAGSYSGSPQTAANNASYYPAATANAPPQAQSQSRARANTINNQLDPVPPALARLRHMNEDVIQGRNALTPVLNRDDAMQEWERRQAGGKPAAAVPYPQLEFLQQQAELVASGNLAAGGQPNWSRYQPPTSKLAHVYQPGETDETSVRRDVVMSNVRSAAAAGRADSSPYGSVAPITSPAQAYTSGVTTSGNRYAATYGQGGPPQVKGPPSLQPAQSSQSSQGFDARADIGGLFMPMQPDQFQPYSPGGAPRMAGNVVPPAQAVPPSFYGSGVLPPVGAARNPFGQDQQQQQQQQQLGSVMKDGRRASNGAGDSWPR